MTELRFDGRVAVVTGAGRGLGRAYAHLLAARGASVVVNDLDREPASTVVDEIVTAGGMAAADWNDVSTEAGGQALVDRAVRELGRLDVLVNNAGVIEWAGFPEVDAANLQHHLAVHLGGSFNTTRAAWPHLVETGRGRIVMTTSTGMLGLPRNTSYAAAKGGVVGLTRSIATAGKRHGINANLIAPAATTRLAAGGDGPDMPPELVAPLVAYLAHDDCPVTGEIYTAGGGRFARLFIASTEGYVHAAPEPTVEDVVAHWDEINDEQGYTVPTDLMDWSATFLRHLS